MLVLQLTELCQIFDFVEKTYMEVFHEKIKLKYVIFLLLQLKIKLKY